MLVVLLLLLLPHCGGLPSVPAEWGVQYGVRFPDRPAALPLRGLPMALENGDRYICSLPSPSATPAPDAALQREEADRSVALRATRATALLRKSLSKQCFMRLGGWWIYEFCFDQSIRQYHRDVKKGVETEYYLGYNAEHQRLSTPQHKELESASHSTSSPAPAKATGSTPTEFIFGEDGQGPYYATVYANGTTCDVSGEGRQTEVRFYCAATSPNPNNHFTIEERQTCSYLVSFYTNLVCMLEEFRPPSELLSYITCHRLPRPTDQMFLESSDPDVVPPYDDDED